MAQNIAAKQTLNGLPGERRLDSQNVFDGEFSREIDVEMKLATEDRFNRGRCVNSRDTNGAEAENRRCFGRDDR